MWLSVFEIAFVLVKVIFDCAMNHVSVFPLAQKYCSLVMVVTCEEHVHPLAFWFSVFKVTRIFSLFIDVTSILIGHKPVLLLDNKASLIKVVFIDKNATVATGQIAVAALLVQLEGVLVFLIGFEEIPFVFFDERNEVCAQCHLDDREGDGNRLVVEVALLMLTVDVF
jgi:hypothetical protein